MTEKRTQLNFQLDSKLKTEAEAISERSGVPVSEMLRRGLRREIQMLEQVLNSPTLIADRRHRARLESGEISESEWQELSESEDAAISAAQKRSGGFPARVPDLQEIDAMVAEAVNKKLTAIGLLDEMGRVGEAQDKLIEGIKSGGLHFDPERGILVPGPKPE